MIFIIKTERELAHKKRKAVMLVGTLERSQSVDWLARWPSLGILLSEYEQEIGLRRVFLFKEEFHHVDIHTHTYTNTPANKTQNNIVYSVFGEGI